MKISVLDRNSGAARVIVQFRVTVLRANPFCTLLCCNEKRVHALYEDALSIIVTVEALENGRQLDTERCLPLFQKWYVP